MALAWLDEDAWCLENRSLSGFASPYIGNGAIGTRVGVLVLGTDPDAPPWFGCGDHPQRPVIPPGDPDRPLGTFSSFVRDGFQYALPSWNHLDMTIGGVAFAPLQGVHSFRSRLDLRTGEVTLVDDWMYAPGRSARVAIRMLIPRTHTHGSLWELEVSGTADEIIAGFGLDATHLGSDLPMQYRAEGCMVIGTARTKRRARQVAQGILWHTDGEPRPGHVHGPEARIRVARTGSLHLTVFHAVYGGLEYPAGAEERVRTDLSSLAESWPTDLRQRNEAIWRDLWASALSCDDLDPADARLVLAQQYYLLASLDECEYPMGALGVSGNNWQGNVLWDADRWIGSAVLGLWPRLARRFPACRAKLLPAARQFAREHGYAGAWFPWMHDEEGNNTTPAPYLPELHNNVWIAHTAWELWLETRDPAMLHEQAWPLLRDIARFFASRCEQDADGTWHLRRVIGPDEALHEVYHCTCDDNVLVNVAVRWLMKTACSAANLVGQPADPTWQTLAEHLTVLPPRADGVIPEHASYIDQGIKQADTILAFYPLDWPAPANVIRTTIDYYRDKILAYGPLMTVQVEATILMRLGDRVEGLARLFRRYREYVRGPFLVPFECRNNDTAVMLTGIGGLLQALMAGWYGWRAGGERRLPRIGDHWIAPASPAPLHPVYSKAATPADGSSTGASEA